MSKTIILVRHGKAQLRSDELPDFERELTEAGVRALKAWLPRAARLLAEEHPKSIELWTSPAVRAWQTADLVADEFVETLGINELETIEMPCLWIQDLSEFFAAAAECESDVVVAVGHNPFMEEAVAQVCGQAVPLATGGIAAVRVNGEFSNGLPSEGRLLWVMQGPEAKRWKAMVDVEDVIAEAVDNVEMRREAFFADPKDVEAAHKYRVSIRTIRGLLSFIEPFMQRDQYSRLQRDWKSLVLPTSRLREYDVLSAEVAQLEPRADALLEACEAARAKECDATLATLSSKSSRKCLERVCEQSRNLVWKRSFEKEGLGSRAIAKRFERVVEGERKDLATLDLADVERTHDVRKQAKQVRYAAERFGSLMGGEAAGAKEVADEMKAVQDRLGALCDARVNVGIIDEFSTKGLPDEALWALSLLRAKNEQFIYETLRNQ